MEWKNVYRGMVMGISDIVPGVSGGTIAVLLGIYDQLITAINGVFSRDWKRHISFLIPLGIGIVIAIFVFGRLMKFLLESYERPTYFFFLGLIIGILPLLFRDSHAKKTFKWQHFILLFIGMLSITMLPMSSSEGTAVGEMTFFTYLILFFSGFIASAAMILPGISGSFILLVLGMYQTVLDAINDVNIKVILTVGAGIVLGIITMSKLINYFLTHYRTATYAWIIGMVIGSVFVIFPGWAQTGSEFFLTVLLFVGGLLIAYVLGKVEYE